MVDFQFFGEDHDEYLPPFQERRLRIFNECMTSALETPGPQPHEESYWFEPVVIHFEKKYKDTFRFTYLNAPDKFFLADLDRWSLFTRLGSVLDRGYYHFLCAQKYDGKRKAKYQIGKDTWVPLCLIQKINTGVVAKAFKEMAVEMANPKAISYVPLTYLSFCEEKNNWLHGRE